MFADLTVQYKIVNHVLFWNLQLYSLVILRKQCLQFQHIEETLISVKENEDILTASDLSESDGERTDTASEHSDDVLDSDIDNLEDYM